MKRSESFLALFASTMAAGLPSLGRAATPVIVGDHFEDSSVEFLVAYTQGFFTKMGLTIDFRLVKSGTAAAAALLAGSLDITAVNIASLLAARQKNIPFSIVALGALYAGKAGSSLVVPKGSTVTSARDLVGKTVGVNAVAVGLDWIATRAYVDKEGGDSSKVRFIEMPWPMMPDALDARRVDAAALLDPYLSVATRSGNRILAPIWGAISSKFLESAYVATADWSSAHGDTARRYNTAISQAEVWANHNHEKTIEILSKFTDVDVKSLKIMDRAIFPEGQQDVVALVQPLIDAVSKYGTSQVTTPAADLFSKEVFPLLSRRS